MRHTSKLMGLLALGVIGSVGASDVQFDDTVIVASGYEKQLTEVPHTIQIVEEDERVLRLQAPTMAESLDTVPGVLLQKTGHGMTSPFLRGFTSQRVVLVADGVRLNNSFLREGPNQYWNQVDPYFFKDLEVMMGPNSVLYGSDAVGGVVYARSKALTRGTGEGFQWQGGEGLFRYSSAEDSFSEHIEGEFASDDKWSMRIGLTRQDFGELKSGDGVDNPQTDFEQWGANIRLQYWMDDDNTLIFGYDHFDQDNVDRIHRTIFHQDFDGTLSKGSASDLARIYDHDRRNAFSRYEMRNGGGFVEELDLQISYSKFEEYYVRHKSVGDTRRYQTDIDTLGATLQMRTPSDMGTWSYGVDLYHDWVDTTGRAGKIQGLVADDATYLTTGVYIQNDYELSDALTLSSGLRYTYAELDADKVENVAGNELSGDWDAVTGSVRLLVRASDEINLYAGVTQGFRAPNLSDATREDDFGGGTEAPTANLDAEHFTTFELGARHLADRSTIELIGYHTLMKDRVGRVKNGGSSTKKNLDDGYVQGVELSGMYDLTDQITAFGSISWQEGREDFFLNREITSGPADQPMSRMHPLTGEVGLRYTAEEKKWWAEAAIVSAGEQDRYTFAETGDNRFPPNGTPSYTVFHLRGGYKLTEATDLAVALENTGDEEYRIHGSGINEAGRNLLITLRHKF